MADQTDVPPDTLNEIGVLKRREIEARIIAPLIARMGEEFGHDRVVELARGVVVEVAQSQGASLAAAAGTNDLTAFAAGTNNWTKGGAMDIDVLEQNADEYSFNVTRCGYADMYHALGIPELGALLSCNRDATMIEGFNPDVTLERTQTIMEGATHCDFRYRLPQGHTPVGITSAT